MEGLPPGVTLDQIPLQVNPSGEPPNFVDPRSLLLSVQVVGITLSAIALLLLVGRLVVLAKSKRGFATADAFVICAWICATGYTITVCLFSEQMTRHAWDTPMSALDEGYLKKLFVTSLLYGPMLFFAKAAILLFYLHAFQPAKWFRMCIYVLLALVTATYWMTVPLCFYYCMPHPNMGQIWDLNILGNCNHLATPGLVQAGMNIAVDIAVFCLPLPIVFKLQMPLAKKLSVAGIFATGLFALIASALTAYYRVRIIQGFDSSWAGAQTYICIQAEVYTSIMVACMPSLAKVWNSRFRDGFRSLISRMSGFTLSSSTRNSMGTGGIGYATKETESTSHLQRKGYSEIYASADLEARPHYGHGIQQTVTVELSSVKSDGRFSRHHRR